MIPRCRLPGIFSQRRHKSSLKYRVISTQGNCDPENVRNMALVAHIDSGKTTLTESILYRSSYISSYGSVDTGSTITDFLPAERERGITIQSACIPVHWKEWKFNLIDTPGHADFGMEVECASRVIDGAVVLIDSVEGVEAQTKGVWSQLNRYEVPTRMVFLNKLDRPGASFRSSLVSLLSHKLHPNPMPLVIPIASFNPFNYKQAEPGIEGLIDIVKWEIWRWHADGTSSRNKLPRCVEDLHSLASLPPSHPIVPHLLPARTALLENLAMFSEELMQVLLDLPPEPSSCLAIEPSVIIRHLRCATLRNEILPVLCGSAVKHLGTELAMDYIGSLLASPVDVQRHSPQEHGSVQMLAWKVGWDKRRGWMTFVRVYSGALNRRIPIFNVTQNRPEKVSKLLLLYASEAKEVDELPFGSVGVILGLKHTRTGDTLVSKSSFVSPTMFSSLQAIKPPPAVISASVIPRSHSDLDPVQDALQALIRTDPSVRIENQDGQILIHGLGALHLEIVEGRLRDEWDVNFEFGRRRVSYREGVGPAVQEAVSDYWQTEIAGKSVVVPMSLSVRSMVESETGDPAWDGNIVVDDRGDALPSPIASVERLTPLASIARGLTTALSHSPHTSLPISRVHVQVNSFSLPPNVPSSVLTGASAVIMRHRIRDAGMGPIMEPYVQLKISVNEDSYGKVVKDLTENGGELDDINAGFTIDGDDPEAFAAKGVYMPPEWVSPSSSTPTKSSSSLRRTISAVCPLGKALDYSNRLRALSRGHGTFEMANAGFKIVSDARKSEILREVGRA